jgi:hypothetical protein
MNGWSPTDAIAMERRHIIEGEKVVARQAALVLVLHEKRHSQRERLSIELLDIFQDCLKFSRRRLLDLEQRYGELREQ